MKLKTIIKFTFPSLVQKLRREKGAIEETSVPTDSFCEPAVESQETSFSESSEDATSSLAMEIENKNLIDSCRRTL